jgi:hypothetical protein
MIKDIELEIVSVEAKIKYLQKKLKMLKSLPRPEPTAEQRSDDQHMCIDCQLEVEGLEK